MDVEEWEKVQLAEIKHGRLAMVAVVGALVQETVTGEGAVEQLFTGNVSIVAENIGSGSFLVCLCLSRECECRRVIGKRNLGRV